MYIFIYYQSKLVCGPLCEWKKGMYSWHIYIHTSYVCVPWVFFLKKWINICVDIDVCTYTYNTRLNMCGGCCASGGPTDVCYQYIFVWLSIYIYTYVYLYVTSLDICGFMARIACLRVSWIHLFSFFEWPNVNYICVYIYIYIYIDIYIYITSLSVWGAVVRVARLQICAMDVFFSSTTKCIRVFIYIYV